MSLRDSVIWGCAVSDRLHTVVWQRQGFPPLSSLYLWLCELLGHYFCIFVQEQRCQLKYVYNICDCCFLPRCKYIFFLSRSYNWFIPFISFDGWWFPFFVLEMDKRVGGKKLLQFSYMVSLATALKVQRDFQCWLTVLWTGIHIGLLHSLCGWLWN